MKKCFTLFGLDKRVYGVDVFRVWNADSDFAKSKIKSLFTKNKDNERWIVENKRVYEPLEIRNLSFYIRDSLNPDNQYKYAFRSGIFISFL